jgi:hypothetical protein
MSASSRNPARSRRGVVLLIVVILLALFAAVGLGFMLYAESEASSSRIYRESQAVTNKNLADISPQDLLNYAMGQLIYGCRDDGTDLYSAMRSHNLSLTMYGFNYRYTPGSTTYDPSSNQNTVPFNGLGTLRTNPTPFSNQGLTDWDLPNYQYFALDGFIRDPERFKWRTSPSTPADLAPYLGGANAPYTAPDRNNMFLAQVVANDPSSNLPKVLAASFVRPNPRFGDGTLGPNNPAWYIPGDNSGKGGRPQLKYMVLRPRPADNGTGFPPPEDIGGDVKNLAGVRGYNSQPGQLDTNDSYWIDLGYPVQVTATGTKFKPLFAFLVMDLEHMLNLNVHGNIAATTGNNLAHASNQGLGAHEVNLSKLFTDPNEYKALFQGSNATGLFVPGRYGDDAAPNSNPAANVPATPGIPYNNNDRAPKLPPFFAPYLMKLDFDCIDNSPTRGVATKFQFPTAMAAFPTFGSSYDNLSPTLTPNPQTNNPFLYSALRAPQLGDRVPFGYDNLYYLYGTTGALNSRSDLAKLIPGTLLSARARFQMTTGGFDLDAPGIVPWVDLSQAAAVYTMPNPAAPGAMPDPYPGFVAAGGQAKPNFLPPAVDKLGQLPQGTGEYTPNSGRAAVLGRLDLNRKLASFYNDDGTLKPLGQPAQGSNPATPGSVWEAMQQRQAFAKEIYERLVRVTGANPNAPSKGQPDQHNALRYLAQLAVNIVDYIDEDDISTPFYDWSDTSEYVFGTELPKLVLNEAYAEMRNIPGEDQAPFGARTGYQFNFWLELLNPLPQSGQQDPKIPSGVDRAAALLYRPDPTSAANKIAVHRILVAQQKPGFNAAELRALNNATGDPTPDLDLQIVVSDYTGTTLAGVTQPNVVLPNNNQPPPAHGNTTYYVIGPTPPPEPTGSDFGPTLKLGQTNVDATTQKPSNLSYNATNWGGKGAPPVPDVNSDPRTRHTILLQRLANPWLPLNPPDPQAPGQGVDKTHPVNPYITIDYITDVVSNDAVKFGPNATGKKDQRPEYSLLTNKHSYGRTQPYAAANAAVAAGQLAHFGVPQTAAGGAATGPANTFFQQNTGAVQPDWLVHVDRAPISVPEIIHVSGYKPHELTQQFVIPANQPPLSLTQPRHYGHLAPWVPFDVTDPTTNAPAGYTQAQVNAARIFRALDTFTVSDRSYRAFGGRTVGKININTLSIPGFAPGTPPPETFMALSDPQPTANYFQAPEVLAVWNQLTKRARVDASGNNRNDASVTSGAFWGAGPIVDPTTPNAAYPDIKGTGVQNTIYGGAFLPPTLANNPTPGQPPNPYAFYELLTKLQNNLTTRSNTFAVFLTVGFFHVTDDTQLPVKLGAEFTNKNGQPTRHRMFAVVDRTQIGLDARSSDTTKVPSLPDTQFPFRQADGSQLRPAVLTSESSIQAGSSMIQTIVVAGGDPTSYDPDGSNSKLTVDTGMAPLSLPQFGPGGLLWVDVGDRQELAKIMSFSPIANTSYGFQLQLQFVNPANLTPQMPQAPHAAGFMLSNVRLGNPGPQGKLDLFGTGKDRYKYVVPYTLIIE